MKVKNIGVDLVEVKRFRQLPYRSNRSFYQKIFTDKEIEYCLSKRNPYEHFAARFAGKEAVLKALNSTVYQAKKIEILNEKNGIPIVKIKNPAPKGRGSPKFGRQRLKIKIFVSLSHAKDYAAAVAIAVLL